MNILRSPVIRFLLTVLTTLSAAHGAPDADAISRGVALRNGGNLQQSIDYFHSLGAAGGIGVAASGELGVSLLRARHYQEAEPYLREAYGNATGSERARYAIEIGNLAAARHRPMDALRFYAEARTLASGNLTLTLVARIDEARLAEPSERPVLLAALSRDLSAVNDTPARRRMRLSVGTLASEAGSLQIAYQNLDEARTLAVQGGDARVEVEAEDGLAQLYEGQGRNGEALQLSRRGIARAQAADGMFTDILLRLEWRQGRLLAAQGANEEARAAYLRAIEYIESIRQDIPIEYENGRSSFRNTLEPIYLGLIDLLLKKVDTVDEKERAGLLRRTRDIAELIKQSELQEYLGERCSIDSLTHTGHVFVEPRTAIFYPIVLKDRLELIFESSAGIRRHTTPMSAQSLRKLVSSYAEALRNRSEDYRESASQLYDILIRPFAAELKTQGVQTLLVVPDGVLRLLPWATLFDGQQFLVENYAVVINSGLWTTGERTGVSAKFSSLVAGMANPGPVVEKFLSHEPTDHSEVPNGLPGLSQSRAVLAMTRSIRAPIRNAGAFEPIANEHESRPIATDLDRIKQMKERLALPGVKVEIDALSRILPGTSLLDGTFTVERLQDELGKGKYQVVHVASHGYFGSNGDESFIMAYDELVTMDKLQQLLQMEGVKRNPIELLTLSACETAEGDDRSPLGFAGAAIKVKAKSVLGTLWPVSDDATQEIMIAFYGALLGDGVSKTEALRRAQVALLGNHEMNNPFFWAPFIIVGNWH